MAVQFARARGSSFNLKVDAVFGVNKAGTLPEHGIVGHGSKVDEEVELITRKKFFQAHAFSVRLVKKTG